jgi:hypothetical protein
MGRGETSRTVVQVDVVSPQLGGNGIELAANDMLDPKRQVFHDDAVFNPVRGAVEAVQTVTGKIEHCLPQGLTRNGTRMQAKATDNLLPFDQGNTAVLLGRCERSFLTGRPTTNDDEVVFEMLVWHATFSLSLPLLQAAS